MKIDKRKLLKDLSTEVGTIANVYLIAKISKFIAECIANDKMSDKEFKKKYTKIKAEVDEAPRVNKTPKILEARVTVNSIDESLEETAVVNPVEKRNQKDSPKKEITVKVNKKEKIKKEFPDYKPAKNKDGSERKLKIHSCKIGDEIITKAGNTLKIIDIKPPKILIVLNAEEMDVPISEFAGQKIVKGKSVMYDEYECKVVNVTKKDVRVRYEEIYPLHIARVKDKLKGSYGWTR